MKKQLLGFLILAGLPLSSNALADDQPNFSIPTLETNYSDAWHFKIGAYYWFSAANGYFKIKHSLADVNLPLTQVRQHLDFGGQGFVELHRADLNWSLFLYPSYIHYTENAFVNGKRAKVSQGTVTIDVGGYYLLHAEKCPTEDFTRASIELEGAGRIMTFHSTVHFYDNSKSLSDGSGFLVPILGARANFQWQPKHHAFFKAEFGGFKISNVNSTWSAMLGYGYKWTKNFDINLAYQALGVNYTKVAMTNNMLFQGPLLGLSYAW